MYDIFVEDLEFYAYHGVSGEEQILGHRYSASIRLTVGGRAHETDHIQDTVDYGAVGAAVHEVALSANRSTLERLASDICSAILDRFSLVTEVELSLAKRQPPMPLIAGKAGVILKRARP